MSSAYSKLGCKFARATVTYIGKVIVEGQVQPMGAKVQAIHFLPSKLKNELKKIFGIVGNYWSEIDF